MTASLTPGLLILHGNQMELLRSAVFDWLRANPLGPLEEEIFLVQSNGVAEWLKIALADELGVCAATRVTLPARFLWDAYRNMLGRDQVPSRAPFDKDPLTWRLMRLLPDLLQQDGYAPLARFLADGDLERRLQLAERVADLYDQYQVYRADWLEDWAAGRDQLRRPTGEVVALAPDQRWQACLWREVHASLPERERHHGRASIHARFLEAVAQGAAPVGRLPRRVVLFGMSTLPYQTLQAIAALAHHTQVLFAVPNPCRYYWGDIIEGRELLLAARRRQPQRPGQLVDLAALPLEELHAHSHPLLASWGRQGRDFVRMLDEFDGSEGARMIEAGNTHVRVDLFSDEPGETLLAQVQAAVRDLLPLSDHPHQAPARQDRSIEFHITHSVQREVEVLHDQLLSWFAEDPSLRPRDVVVMVPDIETFTGAIHAVFDQHGQDDARRIRFEIGDVRDRSVNPLLVALEWLLRLPQQRCRQSEVRDLLDVPALARRFGLSEDDLPVLGRWIDGSGVRWGLDSDHRRALGLGTMGEQNAWIFGVRRMLLGYACGAGASFDGIEPYAEVGGLDAALAGSLAELVEALLAWRSALTQVRRPSEWGVAARALLAAFFQASDEAERLTLVQLDDALQCWLDTADAAGFDEAVNLAVLREAWLTELERPTLNHQFVSGGVTFCTLMPMRAVPFRVVCLLGMNDGDFPRRAHHADFDLLALPGMARPGDRSRRDDDRYLMLEALLAARDKFYVSWVGRNVRDNSEQPPSVLVAQLRDYLAAGWELELAQRTTEHPLQPFSRRYFQDGGLTTYAREWRSAHSEGELRAGIDLPAYEIDPAYKLKLRDLLEFLRQPARHFFQRRLAVRFDRNEEVGADDEAFSFDHLEHYSLLARLLGDSGEPEAVQEVRAALSKRAERLGREGALQIGLLGTRLQQQLVEQLVPARSHWLQLTQRFPEPAPKLALSLTLQLDVDEVPLDDWIDGLRKGEQGTVWLMQIASRVLEKDGTSARPEKLLQPWLWQLASSAAGTPVTGYLVARDAALEMAPLPPDAALAQLNALARLWRANLDQPLALACKTAFAFLTAKNVELGYKEARNCYAGSPQLNGEGTDPYLARLWPDFDALLATGAWPTLPNELYGPLLQWLNQSVHVTPLLEKSE